MAIWLYQIGIRGVKRRKGGVPTLTPRYGLLLFALLSRLESTHPLSIANATVPPFVAALHGTPEAILMPVLAASGFRTALPARAPLFA